MKISILINVISLILQSNNFYNNIKVDIKKEFGITASELFNYEGNSFIKNQEKIYFENEIGYFVTYCKENNDILGSVLFEPKNEGWKINTCYKGSYVPYKEGGNYYVNGKFLTFKEKINSISLTNDTLTGVTYGDVIDTKLYFPIKNIKDSDYYIYSSSYLQEKKILNVPNYMNTQYYCAFDDSYSGCVPTTAAMNFAYLEDNDFNIIINSNYKNLPIKHTDDKNKVYSFIKYLGDNYFNTTAINGTMPSDIIKGNNDYLDETSFANYSVYTSNNYNEFVNATCNAKNPVHVSSRGHSFLGIGYKEIHQSNGETTRLVIGNRVADKAMTEIYENADNIRTFYFIHI